MYLLFDGVSSNGYIGIFSGERELMYSENFEISGNESTMTISLIDEFVLKYNISYSDIRNIICVVGPGSFTGIRTISLVVNTLAYIYPHILLTPVNFFDMYHDYPIVKSSSKRDLFVKMSESDIIQVLSNVNFEGIYSQEKIFGDVNTDRFTKNYTLSSTINYSQLMRNIEIGNQKKVAPLYCKKPNIS